MGMASEPELRRWIAESTQNRRRVGIAAAVLAALGFLLMFVNGTIGFLTLALAGLIAGAGFWIISAHIADWEGQLRRRRGAS